jgi:signal transduction histidine kinase
VPPQKRNLPLGVKILGLVLPLGLAPIVLVDIGGAEAPWLTIVLIISFSLIAAGLLGLTVVRPLAALSRGTERIARGDFDIRVPETRGDEIGQLTVAFNSMAASLASYRNELVRAENFAALGKVASVVAHEVRNPLNAIRGCIDYLRLMRPDDRLIAHHVDIIGAEIERLNEFVGDFLRLARLSPPSPRPTDLAALLASRLELRRAYAEAHGIAISIETGGLPTVSVDPQQIGLVFENLVHNAIDAMPNGGALRVVARVEGPLVVIEFSDTGVGMTETDASQVFTPFFTTKKEGSGIGLATSRRIVEMHCGTITFTTALNRGTSFTVRLLVNKLTTV